MANPYRSTQTHKSRILIYLRARQPKWIIKGELENQSNDWGCFGDTIARRLRELVNEDKIEVKKIKRVAYYRLKQGEAHPITKPGLYGNRNAVKHGWQPQLFEAPKKAFRQI